jgi:putative addiction module antidote
MCYNYAMVLKVTRVGNSLGVILPKDAAALLNVEAGDQLYLTPAPGGYRISPYDPEFEEQMTIAKDIMKSDRNILRELAK